MRRRRERGFTLIELIIAITLLSAIMVGMLAALRSGLLTMERVQTRLQEGRGELGLDQMIRRQIGGIVPARGTCGSDEATPVQMPVFRGSATAMLLVTSYSVTEGARGYPHLVEYRVTPNDDGTARVVMQEMLYPSPATLSKYCTLPGSLPPLDPGAASMVLVPRATAARFLYREMNPETRLGGAWLPEWAKLNLPYAVRIELQPAGSLASLSVPLHISREFQEIYADSK